MNAINPATNETDLATIRDLFRAYADSLPIDLSFQNFAHELASLPGDYAAPRGALFLARVADTPVGCIGLRPFAENIGELKRLYVLPEFRGRGLARSLVSSAISAARRIGYTTLVLDTLASMHPAIRLYKSFGFQRIPPYYPNPLADAVYFRATI